MAGCWEFTVRYSTSCGMTNVSPGRSGAGCAHLNSSAIHESVQVQTAQGHSGPGFQEVLPSTFSQSLLKKWPLLSGTHCSITDIGGPLARVSSGGFSCWSASGAATWEQGTSAVRDATLPFLHSASAEAGCHRHRVVYRPLSDALSKPGVSRSEWPPPSLRLIPNPEFR
jgi:hypothetical protein